MGGLDLAQERAALARTQRLLAEVKLSLMRGESAPIQLLAQVLAAASQAVAERFDHLPARVRLACPGLSTAVTDRVMATIAEARNEWVSQTVELVSKQILAPDDIDPETEDEGEG